MSGSSSSMWEVWVGYKVLSAHARYDEARKALADARKTFRRARIEAPISESDLLRYRNYRR